MAPFLISRQTTMDDPTTDNSTSSSSNAIRDAFTPTDDQKIILIIIAGYTGAILLLWNMPIIKIILAPFKVQLTYYKKIM